MLRVVMSVQMRQRVMGDAEMGGRHAPLENVARKNGLFRTPDFV
jgi:hypothetical protein